MPQFRWIGTGVLPPACDLRRLGWILRAPVAIKAGGWEVGREPDCPLLADRRALSGSAMLHLLGAPRRVRQATILCGMRDAEERARLLRLEFGDVAGADAEIDEIAARALRLIERLRHGPLVVQVGALCLDLELRDARVAGRRLALHPREFALLWKLAAAPGEPVSLIELLRDVWALNYRPETNSVAVHVSRLRAKLRVAGLDGLIESVDGGYRLAQPGSAPTAAPALARWDAARAGLDARVRMGEETA